MMERRHFLKVAGLGATAALADGWLAVSNPPSSLPKLSFPLDAGEAEAIGLALETGADVLLVDEKRGREAARRNGLAVGGLRGELLHARQAGTLSNLRAEINRLRSEAGFFVDAEIEQFILKQVGE